VSGAGPLGGARFAVLGVAHNGRHPPELTEVAVVHVEGGELVRGPLVWRLQPGAMPTRRAVNDFGVRRAELLAAPVWAEAAEQVTEALAGRTLVAHDLTVGYRLLRAYLPDWQPPAVVELARLARAAWHGLTADDLPTLAEVAGLNPPPNTLPRGAASTAHTAASVLLALIRADASRGLARRCATGEFGA
jgi:exodeoxyribonuclease X